MDIYDLITIVLLVIILILVIIKFFMGEPFTNSLKIDFNNKDVITPFELKETSSCQDTIQESVNSELSSQPLAFAKQIYSSYKYPYVGQPELCTSDEHCSQITAECKNNSLLGLGTVGYCGLKNSDTTLFDNKFK